ncbi:MAG: VTT domain-containing protein [bacterium]|nr:VTT domain-containing protein [bacterium]
MEAIISIILSNYNISLFIGMLFLGEVVLLPAIYYSLSGNIGVFEVIYVSAIATLVSDLVWYYLAFFVPIKKITTWKHVEKHQVIFQKLSTLFDRYGLLILFLSKFVYGTRILVQIICGLKQVNIVKYLIVNTIGVFSYIAFLYVIALSVSNAISFRILGGMKISMIVFIVLVIIINLWVKYYIQRKIFQ